jgi:hypothetical protein
MNSLLPHRIKTRARLVLTAAGLGLILGCGDDTGLEKRFPVSGTVTYKDQPVEKGQISFIAADKVKQRDANGTIENGRYTLTTSTPGDGALPGKYKVTIISKEIDPADTAKIQARMEKQGGSARQEDTGRAAMRAKNFVPGKYQLPDTSGLEVTVEGKSNTFDFPLKD